ncbi:OLC1v1021993C1 [Oldenlandia corymbosa var. corymbosa]|uniref:OLC1v1021993C1 n=1 Tax=Oldenlandia corymbosa var. corymbosa TaxID=529605 RepID=A0AAV1BYK6_OLDCO|nr:OLC1v1021993C1 [Oldenlandia corymbosa var. corymbosa]
MAECWYLLMTLLILPLLFIFHLRKKKTHKKVEKTRKPPGPGGLPLIGNLHQLDGANPHESLRNLSNKYGPLVSLRFGNVPVVVISSAKAAKEALKTHDLAFSARPRRVSNQKLSYNGLDLAFSPYGEYWREVKKVCVSQIFSPKRVQSFRPILEDEVSLLINEISHQEAAVINLSSMALNFTNMLICRIAYGKKFDKESHTKKRFDQNLHQIEAFLGGYFVADYFPSLGWIDKLLGTSSLLDKNFKDLDSFYQQLIEEHLDPNRPPDSAESDLLDILIQIKSDPSSSLQLTWDHVKAILTNMFVAGTNTNSAVIIWAMTALIKAPTIMKRVQAEIRNSVGEKGEIGEEVLQQLPYLDAAIKETLRLYPPGVILPRETMKSCSIQGYDIQAKSTILINVWAISRDPESWKDPEEFNPDRFLNSDVDVKGNDFELIPFGSGRRGCPGMYLGLLIVKVTLANLLYSFDWELPSGVTVQDIDTQMSPGLILHKKTPLCLLPKKFTWSGCK